MYGDWWDMCVPPLTLRNIYIFKYIGHETLFSPNLMIIIMRTFRNTSNYMKFHIVWGVSKGATRNDKRHSRKRLLLWRVIFSLSAPKCLFIFYRPNFFSLRLTENLHERKHFLKTWSTCFVYIFSVKCIIKKNYLAPYSPIKQPWPFIYYPQK